MSLSNEWGLDKTAKEQPPINIDDLLFTTWHLLAVCDLSFPTFRILLQLNTIRKMMCSSTARPGCLIESNAHRKTGDALKYKDIELFMVKHPQDPSRRELLLKVKHRLIKGRRNMGRAPIFTYTERNDNLGLCVIQDILTFAFQDDAFASPDINCPRDIWRWTDIPEHRLSIPIHFKKCLGDVCIFRGTTRNETHSIITDPIKPWKYRQAEDMEKAASGQAGFKDEGTFYKYRKGAAAEIRHLDEYSRNIVMGHNSGKSFANYVSVRDDVQSAFMGTPARDALLNLACNASLTRDASAPSDLALTEKRSIEIDPELVELKEETGKLRCALFQDFRFLELARQAGDPRYRQLRRLQTSIRTHRKRLYNSKKRKVRQDFFENVGNDIIAANRQGKPVTFTADVSHIQPERKELAELEFKNRDTADFTTN
ncbi:unnamed protein product [Penicillium manginii]